jgi:hypothetical protein
VEKRARRRTVLGAGAVAAGLAGLLGLGMVAGPAGSQTYNCSGTSFNLTQGPGVLNDRTSTVFSYVDFDWVTSRTYDVPTIPAGTYTLDAVSYDGYDARASSPTQPSATSGTTSDIADGVIEAWWSGGIGTVTLSSPVSRVRVVHGALGTGITPNSVNPVCVGGSLVSPPTTQPPSTTVPPTTAPPTTTAPTTTTTSIPVEVLPEVLPGTPVPRPQVVSPTYTG